MNSVAYFDETEVKPGKWAKLASNYFLIENAKAKTLQTRIEGDEAAFV